MDEIDAQQLIANASGEPWLLARVAAATTQLGDPLGGLAIGNVWTDNDAAHEHQSFATIDSGQRWQRQR